MYKSIFIFILIFTLYYPAKSAEIRGKVTDAATGEILVGCTIYIKAIETGTTTGLDGSYLLKNIPVGTYNIQVSYISYASVEKNVSITNANQKTEINFKLHTVSTKIGEVVVNGHADISTERSARSSERNAINVINVMSAKSIELSPDYTVANVIQRISGVTIERNSTGDGQYAILRGMDKRFNYTMVNGMKIPSPDNKNRFVPLDIFPSELLDRLEVTKSLTANMEGDGIGGAINMVMKDAPNKMQLTVNLATGYNTLFFNNNYQFFDISAIDGKSPNEKYGLAFPVQMKDFTTKNLHLNSETALPNLSGGFSYGDRFLKNKIGIMLAGSYQKSNRANSSDLYSNTTTNDVTVQEITHRFYSNQQNRSGLHAKLDIRLSPYHKLMWYNAYMDFRNSQVREAVSSNSQTTRLRWNRQRIMNSTLKGLHSFDYSKLNLDWSVSYGKALNETPDNVQINENITSGKIITIDRNEGASRRWEHNSDKDIAGYANLTYNIKFRNEGTLDLSTGGMYRSKVRGSYFNEYHFKPVYESTVRGVDYNNFDEIEFNTAQFGNLSDPLNYDATEKIGAGYLMGKLSVKKLEFIAGVRAEHTNQGYNLKFVTEGARNEGNQEYVDVLPSFNVKYAFRKNVNLRISYYKAINRPSFFEIVPYSIINEDYKERGNPDLKHTVADNYDFRWEYFPGNSEQFMVGLFYKKIKDPIEYGFKSSGQDQVYMPMNYGDANNYGIEVDIIKYFRWFGIKANYTYTNSNITTQKKHDMENPDTTAETNIITEYVNQTRPLFGQAEHVINFSLLFKDKHNGWDGQLAFSYTGNRISVVSPNLNEDIWQAGYSTMDASIERKFKSGLTIFAKASNLLNSPLIRYRKPNENTASITNLERYKEGLVERKEYYGLNILLGLKFKF